MTRYPDILAVNVSHWVHLICCHLEKLVIGKKIGAISLSIFYLPCIQIQWKYYFAVSQFLARRLQQFYAYVTTA